MTFGNLIDRWSDNTHREKTNEAYSVRLDVEDAARLEALADLFPGLTVEQAISDLLRTSLDELEAAMPYEPGDKVISEDEFGDPIFEDAGLTPRYRQLIREKISAS